MSKQRWRFAIIGDFGWLCQKLPHMQNNIFNSEQPYKDIEFDLWPHYYSDIIMFISNIFLTFIAKHFINSIHKTF